MFGTKHSKTIDWKIPQKTRQMNWVENIQIEMRKYKAVGCFEIQPGKVSICSFLLLLSSL